MASFNQKDPIHWCKATTPGTNPMQLKFKGISPNGTVSEISLANGKADARVLGNVYAQLVTAEKLSRDWVRYEDCESCEPVPALDGDRVEALAKLDLCKQCMARELIISTRQEAKNLTTAEYGSMFESKMDKLAKVIEANMVNDKRPTLTDDQVLMAMQTPTPEKKPVRKSK